MGSSVSYSGIIYPIVPNNAYLSAEVLIAGYSSSYDVTWQLQLYSGTWAGKPTLVTAVNGYNASQIYPYLPYPQDRYIVYIGISNNNIVIQGDPVGLPPLQYSFSGSTSLSNIDGVQFTAVGSIVGPNLNILLLSPDLYTFSQGIEAYPQWFYPDNDSTASGTVSSTVSGVGQSVNVAFQNLHNAMGGSNMQNNTYIILIIVIGLVIIIILVALLLFILRRKNK